MTDGSEGGPVEDRPVIVGAIPPGPTADAAPSAASSTGSAGGFGQPAASEAARTALRRASSPPQPLARSSPRPAARRPRRRARPSTPPKGPSVANGLAGYDRDEAATVRQLVRTVGSKTFTLQNGVWTDSAYDPAKQTTVTTVQAFSDAHFALLKAIPGLAAYTSLGDNVLVVLDNGKALKISATEGVKTLDAEALAGLR